MHFVIASEEHSQLMLQWPIFMLEMFKSTLTSSIKTVNKTDALNV